MSKCRGESDLGLCMTLVLAKRMSLRSTDFRQILRPNTHLKIEIWYCAALFSVQVLKSCTDLDLTLLYISIGREEKKLASVIFFSHFSRFNDSQVKHKTEMSKSLSCSSVSHVLMHEYNVCDMLHKSLEPCLCIGMIHMHRND